MTRLQIVQTALKLCSKIMPNFGKRHFCYFEEGYLNKWINIAAFNRAKTGAFSAVMGHLNYNSDIQLPTAEDTIQTAQITSLVGSPNGSIESNSTVCYCK